MSKRLSVEPGGEMFSHRFLLVILKSRSLDFTSLSLSVVVIFVALTDLYQSRFVYHLKRRRSPRKLVKYIIVWKCLFLSKATENETNREVCFIGHRSWSLVIGHGYWLCSIKLFSDLIFQ